MRKLLLAALTILAITTLLLSPSAWAEDLANGAKVFEANCAACHMGGRNVVNASKTLRKDALEKYGMASVDAIQNQVTNGKNAMPAFRGRLSDKQIGDVAAYVLDRAEKGW